MPNDHDDGSNDTSNSGDDTTASPAAIKPEDLSNIVNKAVTGQLKRALGKEVGEAVAKAIAEMKAQMVQEPAPQSQPSSKKDKQDPEVAALQRQIEELNASYKRSEQARLETEKRAREDRAYADLRSMLQKEVKPEFVDVLTRDLMRGQGRVTFDEDGNPLFKIKRSPYQGMPEEEEELPLEAGVQAYLKSKEAEPFLPSPGTSKTPQVAKKAGQSGSNTRNGVPFYDKPATSEEEKLRRAAEMIEFDKSRSRER
jgi:hypothetical protein